MPDSRSRRAVLRSGIALGSLTVAGCLDGSSGDDGNGRNGTNATNGGNATSPNGSDSNTSDGEGEPTTVDSWPMHRYDAQNTGSVDVEPPTENVGELWSLDIGARILTNPVVDGATVYLRDAEGTVHAVEDGDVLWSEPLGGESTGLSPAIYEDLLLVPRSGGVSALARSDGSEQWSYSTPAVPHELTVTGDAVVFADDGTTMYGLEAGSGEERWVGGAVGGGHGFHGAPVVFDGEAYINQTQPVGEYHGQIVKADIGSGLIQNVVSVEEKFGWGLTVHDGKLFSVGQGMFVFDLDGNKLWEFPTENRVKATPFVANGKVFGVEEHLSEPTIHALDVEDGEPHWSESIQMFTPPAPVAVGDYIVFGGGDGVNQKFLSHNMESFERKWEIEGEFDTYFDPAFSKGKLFFTSNRGKIFSLGEL